MSALRGVGGGGWKEGGGRTIPNVTVNTCMSTSRYDGRRGWGGVVYHTPSIAFRHLPPNSARFGYATEGAFFISTQLSNDTLNTGIIILVVIVYNLSPSSPTSIILPPPPPFSPSLVSLMISVDVKHVYLLTYRHGQRLPKGLGTKMTV